MSSKVHSQGNVPFSWEYKPGESKAAAQDHRLERQPKLPPPPCPSEHPRVSFHDTPIPLPPCAFPQSFRSSSKKGPRKSDDPFLIAYKEVTKSARSKKGTFWSADGLGGRRGSGSRNMSFFACKQSSSVLTEDSILKLPHIPNSRLLRREAED